MGYTLSQGDLIILKRNRNPEKYFIHFHLFPHGAGFALLGLCMDTVSVNVATVTCHVNLWTRQQNWVGIDAKQGSKKVRWQGCVLECTYLM